MRYATILPLLLALLGAAAGCSGGEGVRKAEAAAEEEASATSAGEKKSGEAVPVEVAALARGRIEAVLSFSTHLEADSEVAVHSQAARQVRDLLVEEGQRVRQGQVLVRLQDEEQRTALAKVRSQLDKARHEHERQQRLFSLELIPEQAFTQSTFEVEQLELALEEAERELGYTEVRAPIAGTVTRRLVGVGDHVMVNQHLFDLVDFASLVARVHVPEKELPRLHVGQAVRLSASALGGKAIPARVSLLSPVVDPRSGTVKVTVDVPDHPGLRPGLYVDVALVTAVHDDALLVPKRALVYDGDQAFVYRLRAGKGGDRVERVPLQAALEDEDHVEPAGGLAPGERVVVAGQAGLKDGARVRLARGTGA